jgi:hypothetical protein
MSDRASEKSDAQEARTFLDFMADEGADLHMMTKCHVPWGVDLLDPVVAGDVDAYGAMVTAPRVDDGHGQRKRKQRGKKR